MTVPVSVGGLVLGEGLPKICVPITAKSPEHIIEEARVIAAAGPDLVEWRADHYEELSDPDRVSHVLAGLHDILGGIPLLFTVRTANEGSDLSITPEDYRRVIRNALVQSTISLVDVEVLSFPAVADELIREIHSAGCLCVGSSHHFHTTPADEQMKGILTALDRAGCDVLKLAVMPQSPEDVLRLMTLTSCFGRTCQRPLITMAMGDLGRISRISGGLTGSCVTFAAVTAGSAPGQLPIEELRHMLALLK